VLVFVLKSFVGILSSILSPLKALRTGLMSEDFEVVDTARAVGFRMSWRRLR